MADFLEVLRDRGFIEKTTDDDGSEKPLARLLAAKRVTGYVGFDPTAPSLHVGNLVPIMGLKHLQLCGHRPVVIFGGGTGMVGDPSGKTELRKVLGAEEVRANLEAQRRQIARYLELAPAGDAAPGAAADGARGLFLDNAEWLLPLNYVEFLREVGRHFSVNRMLAAESVRLRLEAEGGLSFLEFNYSLLQAYDFLVLNRRFGCELQMGGGDQWGNIVAGIDLIRRATGGNQAHGITFPLITTAGGRKMGKTEKGAVWLDAARTSPYDFYQYWINTDDRDVGRFLRIFTLLPLAEIVRLERLQGAELREAKRVLAAQATELAHGPDEARKAEAAARALFGAGDSGGEAVPTWELPRADLERGIRATEVAAASRLCESRNAARRLAQQSGLYVNGEPAGEERVITAADLRDGAVLLRAGKKKHLRVVPR
jgi:tyrosyl-tRNA synthetase